MFIRLLGPIVLGTVLGSQGVELDETALLWFLICAGLIWLYFEYRGHRGTSVLFTIVIVTIAFFASHLASHEPTWGEAIYENVRVRVDLVEDAPGYLRAIGDFPGKGTKVAVHLPHSVDIQVGDTLVFTGKVTKPLPAPNPGVFCYQTYLTARGVGGVCWPDEYEIHARIRPPLLVRVRSYFAENITQGMSDPGLVLALVLGDRSHLSPERQARWRELGISHLIAISGTHLSLLALLAGMVINRLPLSRPGKFLALQFLLAAYVLLSGARPSTIRAFLMALVGGWAGVRSRRINSLDTWALVGCCLLVARPNLVHDLSFQLSFGAAGGIILWGPILRFKHLKPWLRWLVSSLLISVVAQLSLLPLLLIYFREFALLGAIATLLVMPFVTILLGGGVVLALGAGRLGVGAALELVQGLLMVIEEGLSKWVVVWSPIRIGIDLWLLWGLFLYAGWRLRQPQIVKPRQTIRRLALMALTLMVVISMPPHWKYPLEVTALNVGQGDCLLIRTPYNQHILIDGGGDSVYWQERGRDVGLERVVPYLKYRGINRIDAVILSHPHEDHLFGLLAVLDNLKVDVVFDNGKKADSPTYQRYLELLGEHNVPRYSVADGDEVTLHGGVKLRFLHPNKGTVDMLSHNDASLVLALDYQRTTMLFTGDLEIVGMLDLLERTSPEELRADLLKVPHHGGVSSFEPRFYEAVSPRWAVICVGPNSFGHPHAEVLQYLSQNGIRWRTPEGGPITFYIWWGFLWTMSPAGRGSH